MNKRNSIFVSFLLMAAGLAIHFLTDLKIGRDMELVGFIAGILFGAGLALLFINFSKKRK